jgi:hypothetical protein
LKLRSALLLSVLILGLSACDKKKDETTSGDPTAPVFTTAVTASNITTTGFTLTWAATDDSTAAADIKFKVFTSTTNNISTADDAEANGTVALTYTANTLTLPITSLTTATTYYVTVLAKDTDSKVTASTATVTTLCTGKIMFLATVTNGSMGGISGADAICNAQKPTGFSASTFKAMLAASNDRRVCGTASGGDTCTNSNSGQVDWVFTANQTICSSDYSTKLVTTDTYEIPTASTILATGTTKVFGGFNIYYGTSTSNNCSDWSNTGGANATAGSATSFMAGAFLSCASAGAIYCVQQ